MTNSENSTILLDLDKANAFRIMGAVRLDAGQPKRAALFIKLISHPTSTYKDLIEFAQHFAPVTFTRGARPWLLNEIGESPLCLFHDGELLHPAAWPSLRAPGEL